MAKAVKMLKEFKTKSGIALAKDSVQLVREPTLSKIVKDGYARELTKKEIGAVAKSAKGQPESKS